MKPLKIPFLFICLTLFASSVFSQSIVNNLEVNSYTQGISTDSIRGRVKISDEYYNVMCDCNDENKQDEKSNLGPSCDPSKIKILEDKSGEGASFDAVRNHIGHPSDLEYIDVLQSSFHCLDGRITKPILGTLGGDMGEFILALTVYHGVLGRTKAWDQDFVDRYFNAYIKYMQHEKFVMCTDDAAVSHLQRELAVEGLNLNNPRSQLQTEALNALASPENNGDTHLRMLLRYPDMYSIDVNIVKMAIKSFYKLLWDKTNPDSAKLHLEVLVGDHQESAFLEVRSNEACTKARLAPLIQPKEGKKDGLSIFVNHLDAVSIRRVDLAKFFTTYVGRHHQEGLEPELLYNRMKHHGYAFLEVTGSFTARNLPFYSINIM